MNEYPKMLVKKGGIEQLQDGLYSTIIVNDETEEKIARDDGYIVYGEDAAPKASVWK